jgi:sulfur carrier protein
MNVFLNGKKIKVGNNLTAQQLLSEMGYQDKRIALEINGEVTPKSEYSNQIIVENDKVEIIVAVGGG